VCIADAGKRRLSGTDHFGCGLQADSSGDGKGLERHARIEMTTNSDDPDASASAGPAGGAMHER